jgi:hypothetical protein
MEGGTGDGDGCSIDGVVELTVAGEGAGSGGEQQSRVRPSKAAAIGRRRTD